MGGREARRCPSVSWGLGPGSSVISSLGPRRGCRLGAYRAESRVIAPGLPPHQPTLDPRNPHPAWSASVTWSSAQLHRELSVLCALSALGLALRPYVPPLPVTASSGSDLVGAAHLAQAHPAGALFCRPLRLSAWAPSPVGGACLA